MANLKRVDSPKYVLELNQEELDGLLSVLSFGLSGAALEQLNLFDVWELLNESSYANTLPNKFTNAGRVN